jgi:hypothetical protein
MFAGNRPLDEGALARLEPHRMLLMQTLGRTPRLPDEE